uniref:Ras and Rab interactor 1a n=1 Tax=Astyanax mexicanus TaxID=7994 RepID=A0A8B9KDN5_ASTMX
KLEVHGDGQSTFLVFGKQACPQRGSLKSISVLDRLLLTYPVWLQLSINSATALHILQREPPGTFLVRKSSTSQKKMLCVRLADDSVPSFVKQFVIREKDSNQTLEKALFRCILKPLKAQISAALHTLHERDGSSKRMSESMRRARENSPRDLFGVQVSVPDTQGIEKIKQKLSLMKSAYSPIDKVHLLLQICKLIYKAMKSNTAQEFGADDFLPALSYVIVQCNMPELLLEVEYMMELLETPWLTGEGGYYLTSVYASLSHIQSEPVAVPTSGLTQQVRESLKEWSRRRNSEARSQKDINLQQVLFQEEDCSLVKTLQWKAGVSGEALTQLCAVKFGVDQPEDYSLYWRSDGELMPLPSDAQFQDLGSPLLHQPLVFSKTEPDPLLEAVHVTST